MTTAGTPALGVVPCACFAMLEDPLVKQARGATRGVAWQRARWPAESDISISFLDGDPAVHQRVKDVARTWVKQGGGPARLTFQFRTDTKATNIRIAFQKGGSWSRVGTTCKRVAHAFPTMNLGWLTPESTDEELRAVVLHEFGHVLGLIHEHLSPAQQIVWNKTVIYDELRIQGWSREQVDLNMFSIWSGKETNHTEVDKDSIMMYPIPAQWTQNGFIVGLNTVLSKTDRDFAAQLYP